jgi:hypothetical protein
VSQNRIKPLKQSLGPRDNFLALLYVLGHDFPFLASFSGEGLSAFVVGLHALRTPFHT